MPSPLTGTACNLISPAAPREAHDADQADPGEVAKLEAEQQQSGKGKYGSTPVETKKSDNVGGNAPDQNRNPNDDKNNDPAKKPSWIEIELKDSDGKPLCGEPYQVHLPDGKVTEGTLDEKGVARVDGIDPGTCQITFPKRDANAWKPQ